MAFTNNVMIVRHGLLAKLVKLWKENRLLEDAFSNKLFGKLSGFYTRYRSKIKIGRAHV